MTYDTCVLHSSKVPERLDLFSRFLFFLLANTLPLFFFHVKANGSGNHLFSTYAGEEEGGVMEMHTFGYEGEEGSFCGCTGLKCF